MSSRRFLILVAGIVCSGCGDLDSSSYRSKISDLVFDFRQVFQTRTILMSNLNPSYDTNTVSEAQLLGLSNSSVLIEDRYPYSVSLDCERDFSFIGKGSGQLSSPTRFVTAAHVISNNATDEFFITFGGENQDSWVPDPERHAQEEDPLLANRLWQIGLENWSLNKVRVESLSLCKSGGSVEELSREAGA